jgi:hypothetical protein
MKTKKRVSDQARASEIGAARSKGGDASAANEAGRAALKQKPGERGSESESRTAGPAAASDAELDCDRLNAGSRKNKRSENGERPSASEAPGASRSKSKGRSKRPMQPIDRLTGRGGGNGECYGESDGRAATRRRKTSRTTDSLAPTGEIDGVSGKGDGVGLCESDVHAAVAPIQELQRRRTALLKARIAIDNQLAAVVSTELGYRAGLEEKERKGLRAEATKLIAAIVGGHELNGHAAIAAKVSTLVRNVSTVSKAFDGDLAGVEKAMVKLAKSLPAAEWCNGVRGFGLKSLAIIVGETGDLNLYANPGKVWKRMGLAPATSNGKTQMPSTWRRKGGLHADEWTELGYSPRRRSLMYVVGECLVKQNDGPYRARYDEAKAAKLALESEEWPKLRCHLHGMLLAVKRLVRDLWKEWRAKE